MTSFAQSPQPDAEEFPLTLRASLKLVTLAHFAPWSHSRGKRVFDIVFACIALLLAAPIMIAVALLIKVTSPGSILFRQYRVGLNGKQFRLIKFRSMTEEAPPGQRGMTQKNNPRITPIGRQLRRWKLDELPQLLNVVRGDMSLVGPRPYLPEYFAAISDHHRQVLRLRPAITGAATIMYSHEDEWLSSVPADKIRHVYLSHLFPEKIDRDLEFARTESFASDAMILCRTAMAVLHLRRMQPAKPVWAYGNIVEMEPPRAAGAQDAE